MKTPQPDNHVVSEEQLAAMAMASSEARQRPRTRLGEWLDPDPKRLLRNVSVVLLVGWCVWWGLSLARRDLIGLNRGWFSPCFGVDFIWHVDRPTRVWLDGGDQYADKSRMCVYPPMVMRMFAWVGLMSPRQALTMWICTLGLMATVASWVAWRCRQRLKLSSIPLPAIIAAVLFSTPMVFAMERGQYDLVTVPIVIGALAIMCRKSRMAQIVAGGLLAIAPWAKVYPGLLGIGLVGLRRWDAMISFAVVGLVIGASMPDETRGWLANNDLVMAQAKRLSQMEPITRVHPWNHSLSDNWPRIWSGTPIRFLGRINGYIATAAILGPILAWVSWQMFRCRRRQLLAFPYLMWVVALATFVPPVANDYSLVFLPLAVLAVCSRRDPLLCCLAIAALALWWQPFFLPINGRLLILIKLVALGSVGLSLIERACELNEAAQESLEVGRMKTPVPLTPTA